MASIHSRNLVCVSTGQSHTITKRSSPCLTILSRNRCRLLTVGSSDSKEISAVVHERPIVVRNGIVTTRILVKVVLLARLDILEFHRHIIVSIRPRLLMGHTDGMSKLVRRDAERVATVGLELDDCYLSIAHT
jgi:hypothetical protein